MLSLRRSASQLFHTPAALSPTSSLSHLAKRRQFILALDGPGIPQDPWAYPLSWSKKNVIAVACGHDIYYQNLDTREIAHLCNLPRSTMGRIRALEFAEDVASCNLVALGTTTGSVQVWDTGEEKKRIGLWSDANWAGATVVSWKGAKSQEFVVGRHDGKMSLYDVRVEKEVSGWKGHKGDVFGAKWSEDQRFLASVDNRGTVLVWDSRNMSTKLAKMRHIGPAKVRRSFFPELLFLRQVRTGWRSPTESSFLGAKIVSSMVSSPFGNIAELDIVDVFHYICRPVYTARQCFSD